MKKRILLIGGNFAPEPTGIGKYNGEMMAWLAKEGHECSVITTYPYYPFWKVQEPYLKKRFWFKTDLLKLKGGNEIKVHRCPQYVPAKPSGLKRILLDFSFALTAFLKLLQLLTHEKYDVIITVVPSFQIGLLGILYRKIKGAKFYYHIQDMQIEAARDLQMIKSDRVINLLFGLEKFILKQADVVSSISEGMIKRIEEKAQKKVFFFPNWADINLFHPLADKESLKQSFGFNVSDSIVLYSGGIGEKQGLESILHAAEELKELKNLKLVICGSGPYKEKLIALAEAMKLSNVIFFPLQPFEKFNSFLNIADVHLVIQKGNASDLVMPSKLTTILAVGGLALVTADKGTSLYDVVDKYQMGIIVPSEDQKALNKGILSAILDDNQLLRIKAREYAELNLSQDRIMQRFVSSFS